MVFFNNRIPVSVAAYVGEDEGFRTRLIALGIVAIVVICGGVIIFSTVLYFRSRSNDECNKKQPSDCDTLEYRNGEGTYATVYLTKLSLVLHGQFD